MLFSLEELAAPKEVKRRAITQITELQLLAKNL